MLALKRKDTDTAGQTLKEVLELFGPTGIKIGQFLAAAPLHPTSTATSVRMRDDRRLVTDGPFAETREQLGGYFLIDASNLDEAIGIAARIPAARFGTVEIRPVVELAGMPEPEK